MKFFIVILFFGSIIAYLNALVVIYKEAKNRIGADAFAAVFMSIFLTPVVGFLYLLLYQKK